ncbi:hypothetical protein LINPERPRIM_LOCUS30687 [Linum perenne]
MQVDQSQVAEIREPQISGTVGDAIQDYLGFDSSFIVEAVGFSGGIWLMWNDLHLPIRFLASTR